MDGTVHLLGLDQKPCFVHYLEQHNKFIVGTYELLPSIEDARLKLSPQFDDEELKKRLVQINNRAGRLILVRGNDVTGPSIEYEFDCQQGGGIFDAKISYNKTDASYSIYVAHSNGSIGIYKLSLNCGNKICLKEHIKLPQSDMLTCIDLLTNEDLATQHQQSCDLLPNSSASTSPRSSPRSISPSLVSPLGNANPLSHSRFEFFTSQANKLVVGDSNGFLTIVHQGETVRKSVAEGNAIWQVKGMKLANKRDIIIVSCENSSWYLYEFDQRSESLKLLYKNEYKDFQAGVTCIAILNTIHTLEYEMIEVMLGSYDETLQMYHIKISHEGSHVRPDVCHKNTISIENGGIWRIKPLRSSQQNQRQLCMAAMYAGSYVLTLDGFDHQSGSVASVAAGADQQPEQAPKKEMLVKIMDVDSMKLQNKPLHYDIDLSPCNSTYCIVDFNNSLCIFKTVQS